MGWMIIIVIALTVFFAGIIIIIMQTIGGKKDVQGSGYINSHVVTDGGVDVKDMHYGKKTGADFIAGKNMYGTVMSKNGAVHHMWNAYFTFLGSGRREIVVFRKKMAIGRKSDAMKTFPSLEISDDKMISSIHCYLISSREGLYIQDAHSLNHTYVNGKRVTEQLQPVRSGSIIRVGHTEIRVTYEYR